MITIQTRLNISKCRYMSFEDSDATIFNIIRNIKVTIYHTHFIISHSLNGVTLQNLS